MSDHWYLGAIAGLLACIALKMGAITLPTLSKGEWACVAVGAAIVWWFGWI